MAGSREHSERAVVAFAALGRSVVNVLSGAVDAAPALLSLPAGFKFEKKTGVRQPSYGGATGM